MNAARRSAILLERRLPLLVVRHAAALQAALGAWLQQLQGCLCRSEHRGFVWCVASGAVHEEAWSELSRRATALVPQPLSVHVDVRPGASATKLERTLWKSLRQVLSGEQWRGIRADLTRAGTPAAKLAVVLNWLPGPLLVYVDSQMLSDSCAAATGTVVAPEEQKLLYGLLDTTHVSSRHPLIVIVRTRLPGYVEALEGKLRSRLGAPALLLPTAIGAADVRAILEGCDAYWDSLMGRDRSTKPSWGRSKALLKFLEGRDLATSLTDIVHAVQCDVTATVLQGVCEEDSCSVAQVRRPQPPTGNKRRGTAARREHTPGPATPVAPSSRKKVALTPLTGLRATPITADCFDEGDDADETDSLIQTRLERWTWNNLAATEMEILSAFCKLEREGRSIISRHHLVAEASGISMAPFVPGGSPTPSVAHLIAAVQSLLRLGVIRETPSLFPNGGSELSLAALRTGCPIL